MKKEMILLGIVSIYLIVLLAPKSNTVPDTGRKAISGPSIHNFFGTWGYMHYNKTYWEKAARYAKAVGFDYIYLNPYAEKYGLLNVPYVTCQDWVPDVVPWEGIAPAWDYETYGCFDNNNEPVMAWENHRMIDMQQQRAIKTVLDYFKSYFSVEYDAIFIDGISYANPYFGTGDFSSCGKKGDCCLETEKGTHTYTFWQGKAEYIQALTKWSLSIGKPVIWNIWGYNEISNKNSFLSFLFNYSDIRPSHYIIEGGLLRIGDDERILPEMTQVLIWHDDEDVPLKISDEEVVNTAIILAQRGFWFGYYANMVDVMTLNQMHKLVRVIPNWENLLGTDDRQVKNGYKSSTAAMNDDYVYGTHPDTHEIFVVFRRPAVLNVKADAIFPANELWEKESGITDFAKYGLTVTEEGIAADKTAIGRGFIINVNN